MFALALYEQERERLVLARDPWGQKPLFYTAREEGFAFASEIKAFLALPQFSFSWDPAELAFLYHCWTPAPDSSPFAGVKQVPPGSSMTSNSSRVNWKEPLAKLFGAAPRSGPTSVVDWIPPSSPRWQLKWLRKRFTPTP